MPDLVPKSFIDDERDHHLRLIRRHHDLTADAHVKKTMLLIKLPDRADVIFHCFRIKTTRAEKKKPGAAFNLILDLVVCIGVVAHDLDLPDANMRPFDDVEDQLTFFRQCILGDFNVRLRVIPFEVQPLNRLPGHRNAEWVDRLTRFELDQAEKRFCFKMRVADEANLFDLPLLGNVKDDNDPTRRRLDFGLDVREFFQAVDALIILFDGSRIEGIARPGTNKIANDRGRNSRVTEDANIFDRTPLQLRRNRACACRSG